MNDAMLRELTILVFGMTAQQLAEEITKLVNEGNNNLIIEKENKRWKKRQ